MQANKGTSAFIERSPNTKFLKYRFIWRRQRHRKYWGKKENEHLRV